LDTFGGFQLFDSEFPELLTGVPFVARDALQARQRIISKFEIYIEPLYAGGVVGGVSNVISTVVQELKAAKFTQNEAAALLLYFPFGFHSNTWYMVFWLLFHLLVDQQAFELFHKELPQPETKVLSFSHGIRYNGNTSIGDHNDHNLRGQTRHQLCHWRSA
jgi:hypothetical protein